MSFIDNFLSYSIRERRTVISLVIVVGFFLLANFLSTTLFSTDASSISDEYKEEVQLFLQDVKKSEKKVLLLKELSAFDPNRVSKEQLIKFGLSKKIARNWQNYVKKGGYFRKPDQVAKIYGLTDAEYQQLKPYIKCESDTNKKVYTKKVSKKKLNVNEATALELKKLNGIGDVLSARIVKYRKLLGGFSRIEQLNEVYGMPDKSFANLKKGIYISEQAIQQLKVNKLSEKQLKKHPYINSHLAKSIVNFRKENGLVKNLQFLVATDSISKEQINKLLPYIDFK